MRRNLAHISDEDLMVSLMKGDHSAFNELYARYAKPMVNYFFKMLWRDEGKAQDFTQDLFLKIINNPTAFDSTRSFKTWLYSVANNMCKNEYKKAQVRSNTKLGIEDYEHSPALEESALERAHYGHFSEAFANELENMDENHKEVIVLRHLEGLSVKDIASQLSINEGTVKSRIFYATKNLANKLAAFNFK